MRLKAAFPDAWAKYGIEWPRLVRVEVLRDPSVREYECWRVSFGGDLTSPCFNAKGPAAVYAEQLRRGQQKPAFSSDNADE
jgi:hypothetical protein